MSENGVKRKPLPPLTRIEVLDLLPSERVAGTIGAHEFLGEGLQFLGVLTQRQHGVAAIFVPGVCAVLQGIDPAKAGLAVGLRGPVDCWRLLRAAASKAGVSSGDLREDIVPPCKGRLGGGWPAPCWENP